MIKTAVYSQNRITIKSCKIPAMGRNQVLVKVLRAGLNPVDAKKLIGDKLKFNPDFIVDGYGVGFDFAGEIVDGNFTGFEKGELVFGTMPPGKASLQELVSPSTDQIARIPSHLSIDEAACLPLVGLTCIQALEKFRLSSDSKVLIIGGSGGVGHLAIQIAKSFGSQVTSIQSSRNFSFVKKLGSDHVLDYHNFDKMVDDLESLGPFDVIFDTRSDIVNWKYPPVLRRFCKSEINHSYITIGGSTWLWFKALVKRITGWNFFESWHELFWISFPNSSSDLEKLGQSGCKPVIEKVLPFTEEGILEGFDLLQSGRTRGKLVVAVSS